MKALLITFTLLFSISSYAVNCKQHPIYCKIKKEQPKINSKFAMRLSNLLYKYSRKYKTNPYHSIAIGMQESRLRKINRYDTVYVNGKYVKGITDVGLFQFHINTIKRHNLDIDRLQYDLHYTVHQHVKLLSQKMKVCRKYLQNELRQAACYHSFTPVHRDAYFDLLLKFI